MAERLQTIWRRLRAHLRRRRLDRDLDDEVAFHLAMREASLVESGLSRAEAREAARRRFGNTTSIKERTRDMWIFPSLDSLAQDIRYTFRTLRRSPGFTAVAVGALALGIGANTAVFSLVDAVRGHALPYRDPDRLVILWGNVLRSKLERRGASYPDYADWRAQSSSFDDMAAWDQRTATLAGGREPERIPVEFVSAGYFSILGVETPIGRPFTPDEDVVGHPAYVTVLSHGLWQRRFGGDPAIVGRTLVLNAHPYTIVGVARNGFAGLSDNAQLWVPFAASGTAEELGERGNRGFEVVGRLKAGTPAAAAQPELDEISKRLERAYPNTNEKRGVEVAALDAELVGDLRPALLALMAAVVFVLLIACANVANLLIARSEARRREVAVRTALGASWGRLVRQLVTESTVLTFIGAGLGMALAATGIRALVAASPVTFPSFAAPGVDARVALFTIAVSLACGVAVGLAPGLQARISTLTESLKESARGSGGRRAGRLRNGLVIAEVSLASVLLVGAGLTIRTVKNLAALRPGYDIDHILTFRVSIPRAEAPTSPAGAPGPLVIQARTLLERVSAVPGAAGASLASDVPLGGVSSAVFYSAEGQPPLDARSIPRAYVHRITPDFFETMRLPIRKGRTFDDTEATPDSAAVVVSEGVAARFWPGQDPIGRRVKFGALTSKAPWLSIVGVVADVKYRGLPENPTADPDLYLPFLDRAQQVSMVVRTAGPPEALAPAVRAAIHAADPDVPIYDVSTMTGLVSAQTAQSRFTMWLMGVFGAAALLLAAVGIYGVMSYLVAQRTREIGIRLALGARPADVLRLVVGSGARLVLVGVAIGAAGAVTLSRLAGSLLYGVGTADASAVAAVGLLAAVALAACGVPALRASRLDPLRALHDE